jgi:GT2 family glycosyltransferase
MSHLSIVIPSRNAANLLACVGALKHCERDFNLVIVDDGIVWPNGEWKMFVTSGAKVIPGKEPFIFSRNANQGIRAAGEDDVILMNDDALLETPGGFTAMQRYAWEHPPCGLLSAKTNRCNHGLPFSLSFVCVLIPRWTVDLIGFLDERFTGHIDGEMVYGGEDDDYSYRARQAGLTIGVFNECVVDHSKLKSTFRPDGRGLPINATRKRFQEIHGFEMRTR